LHNGQLKIHCDVQILDGAYDNETLTSNINSEGQFFENQQLSVDLSHLLEGGFASDIVVVVGGKQFALHKAVLGARSPVFKAMFEHDLVETRQCQVDITDLDVDTFEQLLAYIYSGKIPSMERYAMEMFVVADKVRCFDDNYKKNSI